MDAAAAVARRGGTTLTDWIVRCLLEIEDRQPTCEEFARLLHMSGRTLVRHLEREGTRFRDLALATRNARARALLASGKYPVSDIAYQLGYTDCANFSRSFRRSNGVCPQVFLRQARAA